MPKVYSYIRMSTPEQRLGDSARRQLAKTKEYAAGLGLELDDVVSDIGVSAFRGQNVEFGALSGFIEAVKDGRIDQGSHLVVESLDRLSRANLFDAMALINRLIELGVTVATTQDGQTYSKETKSENNLHLMAGIVTMLRAHDESRLKSERVGQAWGQKKLAARKGKLTGQKLPLWLKYNPDKSEIWEIPERVEGLRRIFQLSRDGWGAHSIARRLNDGNVKPWGSNAKFWQESYIKKLLGNRAVLGEYQPHKKVTKSRGFERVPEGDPIQRYYPSVIAKSLFDQAQTAIRERRISGRGRKGSALTNLFTGLLRCGRCGSGMRYLDKGAPPKGARYLKCSQAHAGGACGSPAVRYEAVEDAVLKALHEIDIDYLLGGGRYALRQSSNREQFSRIEAELEAIDSEMSNLAEAVALTNGSVPELAARMGEAQRQRQEKTAAKTMLAQQMVDLGTMGASNRNASLERLLAKIGDNGDAEERENLRRALAAEIRRVAQKLTIRWVVRVPHEFRISPDLWPEACELTDSELDEICRRYPFELEIVYRSGDVQKFDPMSDSDLVIAQSTQQRVLRKEIELFKTIGS